MPMATPGGNGPDLIEIEDLEDPRLEDYRDIRDKELRGPARMPGLFVGEQRLVVERMLARPGVTKSVLLAPGQVARLAPLVPAGVPVFVAPLPVMKRVAGFDIHRGVLAVGYRRAVERPDLWAVLRAEGPLTVLLCEEITNIDNIGFLFRNAAAFGADAVLLSPHCHDPLYRKSLRVSIGHALMVPFARSADWRGDLERLRRDLGVTLIGAVLDERAAGIDTVGRPQRVGLIVGQEYDGLSPATLDRCDHLVRIPLAPGVDSLNVAVAAAICLHHFSTARRT